MTNEPQNPSKRNEAFQLTVENNLNGEPIDWSKTHLHELSWKKGSTYR